VVIAVVLLVRRPAPIECPNHSYPVVTETDSFNVVPLAGEITAIPEYHDCQRLLELRGTRYGALAGIWVASDLEKRAAALELAVPPAGAIPDSLAGGGPGLPPPVAFIPPTKARAFIEIFAWDGGYAPLGIQRRWNCLYLYPIDPTRLGAWMVPVDDAERCLEDLDLTAVPSNAKALHVTRSFPEEGAAKDVVPAVGRWDWDASALTQYIGVKCGPAWCEVTQDDDYDPSPVYGVDDPSQDKVFSIKGWYDEQKLAVKPLFRAARPSGVLGTIFPDPEIGTYNLEDYGQWRVTGQVAMSQDIPAYRKRFNFVAATPPTSGEATRLTEIAMCHGEHCFPDGGAPACNTEWGDKPSEQNWWARFTAPDGTIVYRCVKRVDHTGHPIPATARWWWEAMDETGWMRCAEGCCSPH